MPSVSSAAAPTPTPEQLALAAHFHEVWRAQWFKDNAPGAPRRKAAGVPYEAIPPGPADSAGVTEATGEAWIDIAARSFDLLTPQWQAENLAAAVAAVAIIRDSSLQTTDERGDAIHRAWLERNGTYASPVQRLPYAQLPWGEQRKDLVQLVAAARIIVATAGAGEAQDDELARIADIGTQAAAVITAGDRAPSAEPSHREP